MKEFLSAKGVPFTDYDVSTNQAAAQEMMRLSNQMGVPVIAIDGQVVVGFDRARLERILASQPAKKGPFGARIADASKIAMKQGSVPVFGAFIDRVTPGSPADKAGLQPGDIVTEINLRPINNAADMENALAGAAPGSRVAIAFMRGPQPRRTEAWL